MTDKQRNYIMYLDSKCRIMNKKVRATDEDLLGNDWLPIYQNITPEYANEVIDKLKQALGMPIEKYEPKRRSQR